MPTYGKPDATGRSSGKRSNREKNWYGVPQDEPWAWMTSEMMMSPAWCALSGNAMKVITRLMVEHRAHAGLENGNLITTHAQFAECGIRKKSVADALRECEALGFIEVTYKGGWAGGAINQNRVSRYRLTFYATPEQRPTNEWKRFKTLEDAQTAAKKVREAAHQPRRRKSKGNGSMIHRGLANGQQGVSL